MARIVICESSPELQHLFMRTLTRLGHEPTIVHGRAADTAWADAILVDVDSDAVAADAAALQARTPELPVIVCSIYPRDARSDAFQPVAHLLKPFTRADLDRAIRGALATQLGTIATCPTASASTATSA
jgi:CheY-like chemotaxis protein